MKFSPIAILLTRLLVGVNTNNKLLNKLIKMATELEQQLDDKLSELKTAMDEAKARDLDIAAKLDLALKEIEDLKTNQPDLTDELVSVQALIEEAKSIAAPPVGQPNEQQ